MVPIKEENILSNWCKVNKAYLLDEWDYSKNGNLTPAQVSIGCHRLIFWKCPSGHDSYTAKVYNRTYKNQGCPRCAHKIVIKGENDLQSQMPLLAAEWDYEANAPLSPDQVFVNSGKKYGWICSCCGEKWLSSICNRSNGHGCPKCRLVRTSFPEQAIFFYVSKAFPDAESRHIIDGYELDVYIPSINLGIEYDGRYYHKSTHKTNKDNEKDDFCQARNIALIRFRDPSLPLTKYAMTIRCVDGVKRCLDPAITELMRFLNKPSVSIDTHRDHTAIIEAYRHNIQQNSIEKTHPHWLKEWDYEKNGSILPRNISAGMAVNLWWKCTQCGNSWQALAYSRKAGSGCPRCGNLLAQKKHSLTSSIKNNFYEKNPELAKEWDYELNKSIDIHSISSRCSKKVFWICAKCDHKWQATVGSRISGNGCPVCGRKNTTSAAKRRVINLDTGVHYSSLHEAAASCNGSHKSIGNAIYGQAKTAYGFHWAYEDGGSPRQKRKGKVINLETNEEFSSFQAAADHYGSNRTSIAKCCNDSKKTARGFHWAFIA